eukprot:TRINITY_DN1503_c2_g1_i1.p1 TRINITY_DN1503_c2_g1~~TRINITY_DN1503_c2_g1_i1.p1  ORF type:complete len:620 (+),score=98.45 TRINITY_DN1503_c2_g1_i1:65-1924(+)
MLTERVEKLRDELREAAFAISAPNETDELDEDWNQLLASEKGLQSALTKMYRNNRQLSSELKAISGAISADSVRIRDDGIERLQAAEELNKLICAAESRKKQNYQSDPNTSTESPDHPVSLTPQKSLRDEPFPQLSPAALEILSKHKNRKSSATSPPPVIMPAAVRLPQPDMRTASPVDSKSQEEPGDETACEPLLQPHLEEEESESQQGSPSPAARMTNDQIPLTVRPVSTVPAVPAVPVPAIPVNGSVRVSEQIESNSIPRAASTSRVPEGSPPKDIPPFRRKLLLPQQQQSPSSTASASEVLLPTSDVNDPHLRNPRSESVRNNVLNDDYYSTSNIVKESDPTQVAFPQQPRFRVSPEPSCLYHYEQQQQQQQRRSLSPRGIHLQRSPSDYTNAANYSHLRRWNQSPMRDDSNRSPRDRHSSSLSRRYPSPVQEPHIYRSISPPTRKRDNESYSLQFVQLSDGGHPSVRSGTPTSRCSSCGGEVRSPSPVSSFSRILSGTESSSKKKNRLTKTVDNRPPWKIVGRATVAENERNDKSPSPQGSNYSVSPRRGRTPSKSRSPSTSKGKDSLVIQRAMSLSRMYGTSLKKHLPQDDEPTYGRGSLFQSPTNGPENSFL